jgi:hypothetical protein
METTYNKPNFDEAFYATDPANKKGFPISSMILQQCHTDNDNYTDCGYCHGRRKVRTRKSDGRGNDIVPAEWLEYQENDLIYRQHAFRSYKVAAPQYEETINYGFTRAGIFFYKRDIERSCCEMFQYRVDAVNFKCSKNQKKQLRRF